MDMTHVLKSSNANLNGHDARAQKFECHLNGPGARAQKFECHLNGPDARVCLKKNFLRIKYCPVLLSPQTCFKTIYLS